MNVGENRPSIPSKRRMALTNDSIVCCAKKIPVDFSGATGFSAKKQHRLQSTPLPVRNNRTAMSLGFYRNNAKILLHRKEKSAAVSVMFAQSLIRQGAEKFHAGPRQPAKPGIFLTVANNSQFAPQTIAGRDGQIDSLVAHKLTYDKIIIFSLFGKVCRAHIHRRMNYDSFTAIMFSDAGGNVPGIGHKIIDARGRSQVPQADIMRTQ